MSKEDHTNSTASSFPDDEAYASFLRRIEEISEWLRWGYSVKGVWIACTRGTPAFSGCYQTFWRYCRMHGLCVRRGTTPIASRPCTASKAPEVRASSQKIWPRLPGKPREFIPRTEDDR